jgi:hypothetical protein
MLKTINQKVLELSGKDLVSFSQRLTDVLNSDSWRAQRGLQKSDPETILTVLYKEMFENDFSYLNRYKEN